MSSQLQSLGFTSTYYHGGLSAKEKDKNMQLWMSQQAQVIVATNAFGMGIDRVTMVKYNIDNIRLLFENDNRFLEQF